MRVHVLAALTYPVDADTISLLRDAATAGDEPARQAMVRDLNARGKFKHAAVGEIVGDIPEESLEWLLAQRFIEPAPESRDAIWADLGRPKDQE